jgi:hypothetical protein
MSQAFCRYCWSGINATDDGNNPRRRSHMRTHHGRQDEFSRIHHRAGHAV